MDKVESSADGVSSHMCVTKVSIQDMAWYGEGWALSALIVQDMLHVIFISVAFNQNGNWSGDYLCCKPMTLPGYGTDDDNGDDILLILILNWKTKCPNRTFLKHVPKTWGQVKKHDFYFICVDVH